MSHSPDRRRLTNLALLLLISASCESEATYPGPQPSGARLDHASLVVPDGDSARVSLMLEYSDGRARPPVQGENAVAWASSNPDIASVDDAGWIRAHRPGESWVSVRVEQLQTGVAVRVDQVPSAFAYAAGNAQEDTVGSSLSQPLVVRVVDRHGDGVPGLRVDFAVKAGGGTVSPSSVTTAGTGEASASWTLGTEATVQTAEAEVVGFDAEPIHFQARGKPGTPYLLVELSGDQQSGPVGEALPAELVAQLQDKHGNPVPGVTTTWSLLSGGGSVSPAVGVTDEEGRASTSWTVGSTAGAQEAMAEVAGLPGVSFDATAIPGPVASLTVAPASVTLDVGGSVQLSATVRDAFGNTLPNEPVSWSSSSGAASVDGSGLVTASSAGSATVMATSGTASGSASITVESTEPPPPASLTKVSGDGQSGTVGAQLPTPLTIRVADAAGNDLPNVAVEWAVTSGGGSVSSGTSPTDGEGLASVTWTLGGGAGTQAVSAAVAGLPSVSFNATALAGPVASVAVMPASATMEVGTSVQLTATLSDAWGNPTAGSVAWSSSNSAVATVSAEGLVSGVAAGSATVTGSSNGASASSAITVEAGAGTSVRECDSPQPEWIWCDDFEDDRLSSYFEYDASGGLFVRASGVGTDGSYGMRAQWATAGQVSAGFLHLAFGKTPQSYFRPVDAGTAIYRDIYWRIYVRTEPGWTGGGGDKLSRATIFASPTSWAQAMIAHVWSGSSPDQSYLVLDPASGTDEEGNLQTTGYNDFPNLRWLGAVRGATPLFADANAGTWYCVEAHARLNDAGRLNGVYELWIDGQIDAQKSGLNWVGGFAEYGINALFFENYWNSGAPRAQERYLDKIVVSTQRIGCGDPPPPPGEVSSVTITPAADTLNAVHDTVHLSATARDAAGNILAGETVTWSSLNPSIATVDAVGRVAAKAAGTALITAFAGCCAGDTAHVVVRQVPAHVSVSPATATIPPGTTQQLTAAATDSNGVAIPDASFTWSTSSPAVATVDATGLVQGVAAGSASITATTSRGVSGSAAIVVSAGGGTGSLGPQAGDIVYLDTRAGGAHDVQACTTLSCAKAYFTELVGLDFTTDFDGAGTHAFRAKWEGYGGTCYEAAQFARKYPLAASQPDEVYFQWKQRMGRHANDGTGIGQVDEFHINNPDCGHNGNAGRKLMLAGREGGGNQGRTDIIWPGPAPSSFRIQTDTHNWGVTTSAWNPQDHVARVVTITVYYKASSTEGAADGVAIAWVDGQKILETTTASFGSRTWYSVELFSVFNSPRVNQTEYFWDLVIWKPGS